MYKLQGIKIANIWQQPWNNGRHCRIKTFRLKMSPLWALGIPQPLPMPPYPFQQEYRPPDPHHISSEGFDVWVR